MQDPQQVTLKIFKFLRKRVVGKSVSNAKLWKDAHSQGNKK